MRKRFTRTARFALRPINRLAIHSLLGSCALAWSGLACALGLGEISLHSALNQPFNADIPLTDSTGVDVGDITVSLGTPEEFAQAGLDRSFFLTDLRFTPLFRNGHKVIHVSSSKVVVEPYLNFIVQVTQPTGQLLRTYTLLIDPPGAVPLAPPLVPTNARVEPVSSVAPMPEPVPADTPPPAAHKPSRQGSAPPQQAQAPTGEQLTATAAENKQLQQSLDNLQARMQGLESESAGKDQQLADLQSRLAEAQALAAVRSAVPAAASGGAANTSGTPSVTATASAPPAAAAPANATATAPSPSSAGNPPAATTVAPSTIAQPQPAPTPAPLAVAPESDDLTWMLQLGALLALLLLIAAWFLQRRRQRAPVQAPLAAPVVANGAVPEPEQPAPPSAAPATARREQAPATDALDAASIYIAYGRFNEALGVLREGLQRQPDRRDLRLRILEVLGLQGNAHAYAEEEAALRANGEQDAVLEQTRARFPKMAPAAVALAAGATVAVAASAGEAASPATPYLDDAPADLIGDLPADTATPVNDEASDLDIDFDALGDLGDPGERRPLGEERREGDAEEFHLNLDDLSMDADWSTMNPFDKPPTPQGRVAPVAELAPEEPPSDSLFYSNLRELPEVLELPEEEFLSDFADEPSVTADRASDELDSAFLDSFADDPALLPDLETPVADTPELYLEDLQPFEPSADALPDLDELSIDFDDIQSQAQAADRLEQARTLLAQGERQEASWLLHELLQDGDETTREAARQLLAGL